jgi:hypothetical protein
VCGVLQDIKQMYKLEFSFSTQTNPPCQNNFGITLAPFKLISSSCSESPPPKKKKTKNKSSLM